MKGYVIQNIWGQDFWSGKTWSSVRFAKIFETKEQAKTEIHTLEKPYLTIIEIYFKP